MDLSPATTVRGTTGRPILGCQLCHRSLKIQISLRMANRLLLDRLLWIDAIYNRGSTHDLANRYVNELVLRGG